MQEHYRHEYKFLISRSAAQLLALRLPHFMQRDAHAGPDGQYTIRSLYFDDPNYTAFYEKVAGTDNRTKYRIRCYNYDTSLFRLERKEKKGHLTRKTGQTLSTKQVLSLLRNPVKPRPELFGTLADELRLRCASEGMRPVVLVDYDRTSFVCKNGNTRITLDDNLRTVPYCHDLFGPIHAMVPVLEADQVILEVKFDDFLPGYLSNVLADIPKAPMAISKFAMCLNLI